MNFILTRMDTQSKIQQIKCAVGVFKLQAKKIISSIFNIIAYKINEDKIIRDSRYVGSAASSFFTKPTLVDEKFSIVYVLVVHVCCSMSSYSPQSDFQNQLVPLTLFVTPHDAT